MYDKVIYKTYRVIGLTLLFYSISLILYYLIVAKTIGHLPTYANPDPKDLENGILILIGFILMISWIITILFFFIFLLQFIIHLIYNLINNKKIRFKSILISSIGIIFYCLIYIVPGLNKILDWILD